MDLGFLIDHVMTSIKPLRWRDVISSNVPLKVRPRWAPGRHNALPSFPVGGIPALCNAACSNRCTMVQWALLFFFTIWAGYSRVTSGYAPCVVHLIMRVATWG